jgi:hypothetical protein
LNARGSIRCITLAALLAASGCFNFDKALRDCRDDGGAWVCGPTDGGAGGGAGGGGGGGGGGAGGGSGGAGGGSGGAGGGSGGAGGGGSWGFASDGGCPGLVREGWCWENPIPGGVHLHDVTGTSDDDVYFAGSSGTVLRFDGTLVHDVAVPWFDTGTVRALSMLPDGGAWAGGDGIGGFLWRRNGGAWVQGSQSASGVRQIVALPGGGVLAATDTGVAQEDATWFPPVDGDSGGCSGVLVAPELGDGGFLAACGYTDAGAPGRTRQVVRSDGTVEVRETQIDGGDSSFFFNRMWQDGAGRRFVAGSGTMMNFAYGSTHLRSDAGTWSQHWLFNNGSGGTDLVAGAGYGAPGSHVVVGQGSRYARFVGTATTPATTPQQLPSGSNDGYAEAAWVSPQGTMWISGDHGYAGAGDPAAALPTGWRVLRSGPSHDFYGAEIVGSQLLAVGGPSAQSWFHPSKIPGPALPNQTWRGVWQSPQSTLWFAAETGAVVRGGQSVAGASDSYHDVWGFSDDEVFLPHSLGLRRWINGGLDSPLTTTADLWKVHGDPATGEVWAVGENAAIYRRAQADGGFVLMPGPASYTGTFFAVRSLGGGRVVLGGDGARLFEREVDGGWLDVDLPNPNGSSTYDIYPARDGGYYAVGAYPWVFRIRNRTAQAIPIGSTSQLERVRPLDGRLYVVGGNGQVLSQPEQ